MSTPAQVAALVGAAMKGTPSPTAGAPVGSIPVLREYGVVQSIQAGPPRSLTITVGGGAASIAGVRYWTSYIPRVGDWVAIDLVGTDRVVVGAIAGGGGIFAQNGVAAVSTNASGVFSFNFPTAFPNSLLGVSMTQYALASSGGGTVIWNRASSTTSVCTGWIFGLVTGTASVYWVALGT